MNELLQKVEKMDNQISSPSFISQNGNNASNTQNQSVRIIYTTTKLNDVDLKWRNNERAWWFVERASKQAWNGKLFISLFISGQ